MYDDEYWKEIKLRALHTIKFIPSTRTWFSFQWTDYKHWFYCWWFCIRFFLISSLLTGPWWIKIKSHPRLNRNILLSNAALIVQTNSYCLDSRFDLFEEMNQNDKTEAKENGIRMQRINKNSIGFDWKCWGVACQKQMLSESWPRPIAMVTTKTNSPNSEQCDWNEISKAAQIIYRYCLLQEEIPSNHSICGGCYLFHALISIFQHCRWSCRSSGSIKDRQEIR